MALTLDEIEASVHGWGIEYEDGKQVVCLQTLRQDKTVINQILVPIEVLNNPQRFQFAIPLDIQEERERLTRRAKLLNLGRDDRERYVATGLTQMLGAIVLDGKEFPMTMASLKSAELLLGMFAQGAPKSQFDPQKRGPDRADA